MKETIKVVINDNYMNLFPVSNKKEETDLFLRYLYENDSPFVKVTNYEKYKQDHLERTSYVLIDKTWKEKYLCMINDEEFIEININGYTRKEIATDPLIIITTEFIRPLYLKIVEVPADVEWEIKHDTNGQQFIEEIHRVWR